MTKRITLSVDEFKLHRLDSGPSTFVETSGEEMLSLYKQMQTIRRMEVAADQLYKQRLIRGFLHLYNGQEAVCVGLEAAVTRQDHLITAYRDHGFQLVRGDTLESIFSELLGRAPGCSAGKGGSMHMYHEENGFYGGNGIVGAQVPIGAGLALALQYNETPNVSISLYGDGAANQGQIFEAYNMAKLWNLPAIFVCENNHYGMGTSSNRGSASTDFYTRGDYVPGIHIDGMDVYAVKSGVAFAKEYALANGPIVLEMETYRYVGHSMSDPGISYRTKEEVKKVRESRDPIVRQRTRMLDLGIKEETLEDIDADIKAQVDEAVKFATAAAWPDSRELFTHILTEPVPARGRSRVEQFEP